MVRDNIYWFGWRGLVFTSPWVVTPSTVRHQAVLLLSATRTPFALSVGGRVLEGEAFAIAPLVKRGLRAVDAGLVSVNLEAAHPAFPMFGHVSTPGVRRLDRSAFAAMDLGLLRAYDGGLGFREATQLFDDLIAALGELLPAAQARDGRAELLRGMLREKPSASLGDLARELNVSYTSASRVFARTVGLPLRSYQHWLKCMRATEQLHADIELTQIAHACGFADSAHLSRAWRRSYGLAPSYVRDARHVRLVLEPELPATPRSARD